MELLAHMLDSKFYNLLDEEQNGVEGEKSVKVKHSVHM